MAMTEEAKLDASEEITNRIIPLAKMRLRPNRSASVPAAINKLPNVSMKALVNHVSEAAVPPNSRPIDGVAIGPPEKLKGSVSAARHTANKTQIPSWVLLVDWLMVVIVNPVRLAIYRRGIERGLYNKRA